MPGTLYHIVFGKHVYKRLRDNNFSDIDLSTFMSGNILPDVARNKSSTHHYPTESDTFFVPDLDAAIKRYSRIGNDSLRLGILGHLWFDKYFTENLIAQKYELESTTSGHRYVKMIGSPHRAWTLEQFFSFYGIYHAYSECNPLIFNLEGIDLDWIKKTIPRNLPMTRFSTLDDRIDDNWLDLLERRLETPPRYTGELLTFDEITKVTHDAVDDFTNYALCELLKLPKPIIQITITIVPSK